MCPRMFPATLPCWPTSCRTSFRNSLILHCSDLRISLAQIPRSERLHQPEPDCASPCPLRGSVLVQQWPFAREPVSVAGTGGICAGAYQVPFFAHRSQPVVFSLSNDTQTGNQSLAFPYQNNETVFGSAQPVAAANFMIYPIYAVSCARKLT